ncbi:hypothetical protein EAM_1481 [Erwinia amylovora ATCC 49946]|nr:hypothetical protein EAM_1481 [Erwinia amylovora ATCC 49946]
MQHCPWGDRVNKHLSLNMSRGRAARTVGQRVAILPMAAGLATA